MLQVGEFPVSAEVVTSELKLVSAVEADQQIDSDSIEARTFLDRIKNFDFEKGDVMVAATIAGIGLVVIADMLAKSKLDNRLATPDGDELTVSISPAAWMKGVASVVRRSDGAAASFPISADVADQILNKNGFATNGLSKKSIFMMFLDRDKRTRTLYPLHEEGDTEGWMRYREAAKHVVELVKDSLEAFSSDHG